MIRNNKWKLILSSVIILLPILVGLILWRSLPDPMPTHWGTDGQPNGWSSKPFAVFGLPMIMLGLHWLCVFFTTKDPKNADQNRKIMGMILWIVPALSLFCNGATYAAAMEIPFDLMAAVTLFAGILFAVIGNYLPKAKSNHTVGIRISWTLHSEANWLATHRFASRLWVIGGLLTALCAFLPTAVMSITILAILTVLAVAPIVYSYCFYRKEQKASENDRTK